MHLRRRTTPVIVALICAGLAACGGSEPPAVTVGPISFTENELLGLTDERRHSLAEITAFGLAVADSATTALGTPLLDEWTDDRRLEILAARLTLEEHAVGDDVLEARYLTDPEWELTVRHILFFSERWRAPQHRAEAEAKAERAMEALRAGADFASTAATLSEEPGAEGREGLLTPGREGAWVPEFWAAAIALEPGQISPVTETRYGYHILRLEDRQVVPFEEARHTVARHVADQVDDPASVLDAWMEERGATATERRAAALAEAEARGIEVSDAEAAEVARVWDDMVYRWSASLGLRYGLSNQQVAAAAMAALSDAAQGADLARRELHDHAEMLRAAYPTRVGREG